MFDQKPGQTQAEALESWLLAQGFKEMTPETMGWEAYVRESRYFLRIMANDDPSIPAPNEDAELRAMGIDPSIIVDRDASSG